MPDAALIAESMLGKVRVSVQIAMLGHSYTLKNKFVGRLFLKTFPAHGDHEPSQSCIYYPLQGEVHS